MSKKLLLRHVALVAAMMCALGASAAEAYANYTPSNTTLTFYYDNLRSSRTGTTYDLNTGNYSPGWRNDGTYSNVTKVVFNSSFANALPTTTYMWFDQMEKLTSIMGLRYLNTSEVTNMSAMFGYCHELTSLDLSHFNTANVTNMGDMFFGCYSLTSLDVSNFNTENVTDMDFMFFDCLALTSLDVSHFNTANVTTMYSMFNYCLALTSLDVSHFNTANVTTMYGMFFYCEALTSLDLSNFNTANVTDMENMFNNSSNLRTIYVGDGWSTAAVTSSNKMFFGCNSLVGGQGTTFDANHINADYAHIDGGPSNPGYFTKKCLEAYACYTPENTTLTFYYDNQRISRPGTTYDLVDDIPGWYTDFFDASSWSVPMTRVVFDPSFAGARPTSAIGWFANMVNLQSITDISYLNTSEMTSMYGMFWGCSGLTNLDLSHFNTANVINMAYMFRECSGLTSLDLSHFNTANVTDMSFMFYGCSNLRTIYVSEAWSTAAVTSSTSMLEACFSLVGGMGTTYSGSNPVSHRYAHIDGGPSNPGYFTEKGPEAYACYTSSNKTLTFYYDKGRMSRLGTIYDLNTGIDNPEWKIDGTYANVTRVVFDPSFIGARPSSTHAWFDEMHQLNSITGTEYLNTRNVYSMGNMFHNCTSLTSLDLSRLNTRAAQIMASMFEGCEALTSLDLSSFNTTNVYDMKQMFCNCLNLKTIIVSSRWSTFGADYSSNMFLNCVNLVGGQGTTYDPNHVDKSYARIDGGSSNPGYLTAGKEAYVIYVQIPKTLTFYYDDQRSSRSGWKYDLNTDKEDPAWPSSARQVIIDPSFADYRPQTTHDWFSDMSNIQSITGINYLNTSLVENMSGMFRSCNGLTSLDVSNFNTANVTDMSEMFSFCTLTSLDVSHFNTAKVTDMHNMFNYCRNLTSLDLSRFNTFKVTDMSKMFYRCNNLATIYASSGWSTAAVTNSLSMFENCTSLVGGQGTTFDENHVDATYAHIDGGPSNPGYFTAKADGQRGDVNGDDSVSISDVTALINYLLSHNATGINLDAANCNQDSTINISDVTALINYLLSHTWN